VQFGRARKGESHGTEQLLVVSEERHTPFDGSAHAGIRKGLGHAFALRFGGQLLAALREMVLTSGMLHVPEEVRPCMYSVTPTTEQGPRGAHCGGIPMRWRKHSPAESHRTLVGSKSVLLGFAAMHRSHLERLAQDQGKAFLRTQVREPIPGEETFDRYSYILALRRDHPQKRCRRGGPILMPQLRAALIGHTDVQRFRMEIDATILLMRLRVEVHPGVLR
jgi:hypothetical protein